MSIQDTGQNTKWGKYNKPNGGGMFLSVRESNQKGKWGKLGLAKKRDEWDIPYLQD